MEKVDGVDLHNALHRFDNYDHDNTGKRFMEFLEIHHWHHHQNAGSEIYYMPGHAAAKLRLLLGPHYLTIIKAWYAKK